MSCIQIFAQDNLFINNGSYKYFVGNMEPDSNWFKPAYSDTAWNSGYGSIGFGDGDDSTLIPKATSVYLRIHFNCTERNKIKEAVFNADFDDGYIAYLNGVEIIRVNLGLPGEYIPHERLADRSHEAMFYRNYQFPLTGYYIDTTILSKVLKEGENLLAVQVHNDSLNGSDLSFKGTLFHYISENYDFFKPAFNFYAQIPLDSSRFPIIIINTDEFGFPVSKKRYQARMSVIYNPENEYSKPTDPFTDYNDGLISIETRGHSTSWLAKKSFNFETQDTNGDNLNVSILGLPPDDDWILYAPIAIKA
jgi:hypothetical protein